MIICSNCGNQVEDGNKFCQNCGNKIVAATTEVNTKPVAPAVEKQPYRPSNVSPKSRLVALLLGIFLGTLGIHNFYLGKVGKGVVQALLTVVGSLLCGFGLFGIMMLEFLTGPATGQAMALFLIGSLFVSAISIWALVEWILIACGKATDKNGLTVFDWN